MSESLKKDNLQYFEKSGFRWVTGVAGTVLLVLGVGLLLLPTDFGWAKMAASALLGLVGANAIYCALNATEPWIAKLGPLP